MNSTVWEMHGRGTSNYWIVAEVYRNAHDNKTYVARIENNSCYGHPGAWIYDIKFGFKTKRSAMTWAKDQRCVVRNKICRTRRANSQNR